jgi:GxxExxY protein
MSEADAEQKRLLHQELSSQIISAFYQVYNTMVRGLLEGCYQNALYVELQERGIPVDREVPFGVRYKERIVGQYRVDLLVDRKVIVECKTAHTLHSQHEAQMLHYLKATNTELGLLMYFGSKPLFRRFVHTSGLAASLASSETEAAEAEDATPTPLE